MPSEIVHCVLCDRRNRAARSKFAKLATSERHEKIYDGYKKRNGYSLNHSLMNIKYRVNLTFLVNVLVKLFINSINFIP